MAINFPSSPSVNDTFNDGSKVWRYTGTIWKLDYQNFFELTGNATSEQVLSGTTFYSNNPYLKLTGTFVFDGNATTSDVVSGQTFYATNGTKLTGTLSPVQTVNNVNPNTFSVYLSPRLSSNILTNRFSDAVDVRNNLILVGLGENSPIGAFFNSQTLNFINASSSQYFSGFYITSSHRFISDTAYVGWTSDGQRLFRSTLSHGITHYASIGFQTSYIEVDENPESTGKIFVWQETSNNPIRVYRKNDLTFLYNISVPINNAPTGVKVINNTIYVSTYPANITSSTRFLYEYNSANNQTSGGIQRLTNILTYDIIATQNYVYYAPRVNAGSPQGLTNITILHRSNFALKEILNVTYNASVHYNTAQTFNRYGNEDVAIFRGTLIGNTGVTGMPLNQAHMWSVYDMHNSKYLLEKHSESVLFPKKFHNNRLYWSSIGSISSSLFVQPLNLETAVINNTTYYKL